MDSDEPRVMDYECCLCGRINRFFINPTDKNRKPFCEKCGNTLLAELPRYPVLRVIDFREALARHL